MATNPGNDKIQNKWESFTSKFKPGIPINMPDLRMTAQDGFCLKDLSDLENSQSMLTHVKTLNISDNLIPKLRLRNFESIENLDASRNMIGEVVLNMKNIQILNLSYNLISKIFELKDLPNLKHLNLSYNIIERVSIKDFFDVKKNLEYLDLSYNKINLEAYDFISFFEGLKNFNIKILKIKENTFLAKSAALRNIYKVYVSLCIPGLEQIDGETIKIDPSIGNLNDLTNQILMDAADLQREEIRKRIKNKTELFESEVNRQLKIEGHHGEKISSESKQSTQNYNDKYDSNNNYFNNESERPVTLSSKLHKKNNESQLESEGLEEQKDNAIANRRKSANSGKRKKRGAQARGDNNCSSVKEEDEDEDEEENKQTGSDAQGDFPSQDEERKHEKSINMIDLFKRIMNNLDNIYIAKFDFQSLYLRILDDLMLVVAGEYSGFTETNQEELCSLFAILLSKLHCFMENADEKEELTVLKIIANLAFIEKGYFSKMVFDYLKSIIISSDTKVHIIGNLVKKAINENLKDIINEWDGEFTILEHITEFFDDSFPINLDDVFQKNIQEFLDMFKKIWKIKDDHNLILNKTGGLNSIKEADNEEENYDDSDEYSGDVYKNSFQLKKTSIIILSKYFQIQVDALKTKKLVADKQTDERHADAEERENENVEEELIEADENFILAENNENNNNENDNVYENYNEICNRVSIQPNRSRLNTNSGNVTMEINEARKPEIVSSNRNLYYLSKQKIDQSLNGDGEDNLVSPSKKVDVENNILEKYKVKKINMNKTNTEINKGISNKLNASGISLNENQNKSQNNPTNQINLSTSQISLGKVSKRGENNENYDNSQDNIYLVNNNNFNNENRNKRNEFELSTTSKRNIDLTHNQSKQYPNQVRAFEEGKAIKSNSNKTSEEELIEEEIKKTENSDLRNNNNNDDNCNDDGGEKNSYSKRTINKSKLTKQSKKTCEKIGIELNQKEDSKNIKLENEHMLNQSINSGRGVIISEKDYSKLKEKMEQSKIINENDKDKDKEKVSSKNKSLSKSKISKQQNEDLDEKEISIKSQKTEKNKISSREMKQRDLVSAKSRESDINEQENSLIRIKSSSKNQENAEIIINQSKLSSKRENNYQAETMNEDELEKKEIMDNIQNLEIMGSEAFKKSMKNSICDDSIESEISIHFKNVNGKLQDQKNPIQDLQDISRISKKSGGFIPNDSIHFKNFDIKNNNNDNSIDGKDESFINKNEETFNNNDSIKFKSQVNKSINAFEKNALNNKNSNNSQNLNNLNKSVESKNTENNILKSSSKQIQVQNSENLHQNNEQMMLSNPKKSQDAVQIINKKTNKPIFIRKPSTKGAVALKNKILLKEKAEKENEEKLISEKLNFDKFSDFYVKMKRKIENDFRNLNDIHTEEDLQIFKAFLDFSSLLFQNIKQLCKEKLITVNSKLSNDLCLHSNLKSDDFADYLLNLIEQLFKRYRIEESDREDNQFDRKFESYFTNYLRNKRSTQALAKRGLPGAVNESANYNNLDTSALAAPLKTQKTNLNDNTKLNKTASNNNKNINNKLENNNIDNYNRNYSNKNTLFEELCELKELIISIVKCLGSAYRLSEPGRLQQNFELDTIKKIIGISKKTVQIDPFIMEASCSFILILLGDEKTKTDYMIFNNLVNKVENYSNFKNLLDLINVNSKKYQDFINYLYSKISRTKIIITDYNLDKIEGARTYVERVIQSIIFIFKHLAKYVLVPIPTILRTAKEMGKYLRDNHLFVHLGNCLKIDNDKIRLNAIKTIFYSKSDKIDLKIMDDIMKTISEYSSITEGETEIILSIVYLLFNKIVYTQVNKTEPLNQTSILNALQKAFEFMEKNLERAAPNIHELVQKNELSISLLLYISTLSKFQIGKDAYTNYVDNSKNNERFYKIMEYDFSVYNKNFYIPVEIERTLLGVKVRNYFEITKRLPNPYSYNFLRVLMKIADILCEIPDHSMPFLMDLKSANIISGLNSYISQRFLFRLYNESLPWNEFWTNIDKFVEEFKSIREYINEKKRKDKRLMLKDQEKVNIFKLSAQEVKDMNYEIMDAVVNNKLMNENKNNRNNRGKQEKVEKEIIIINKIHELLKIDFEYLENKAKKHSKQSSSNDGLVDKKQGSVLNGNMDNKYFGNNSGEKNNVSKGVNNNKSENEINKLNKTNKDSFVKDIKEVSINFANKSNIGNKSSQKNKSVRVSQLEDNNLSENIEENNEEKIIEDMNNNNDNENIIEDNNDDFINNNNNINNEEENNLSGNENNHDQIKRGTRKNMIMDYYAIVLANVKEKIKKKNESSNIAKGKQQIKATPHFKQDQKKFSNLYEQIDFIIFLPNLINYLVGKSQNLADNNISQDLYNKYDQEVIEAIKKFKTFNCIQDLKSFVIINTSNSMKDKNVKSYVKTYYFDAAERNFSKNYKSKSELEFKEFSLREIAGTLHHHKNADIFVNYKEDFYTNCINFNKKTFSQYFQVKSKTNIYWKNEIPVNFDWENIEHIKRMPEAENQNNSKTRSLLVASLLRCVYPVLMSPSKNIRKTFIEILFSEKIHNEFFLYISSGLYLKYNIGQKLLNIISLIYGINFHHVIDHLKGIYLRRPSGKGNKSQNDHLQYNNSNNHNNSNSHNSNNNYYKQIQNVIKNEALPDYSFKFYCKLLEIISIMTIFIKKIYFIGFMEKNMHYKSNHNFLNVFIHCLNQILNSITNCIFPDSFKESLEILVINNLIKNNLIKNILPFVSFLEHLNKKVSNILYKKILLKNFYEQNLKLRSNNELEDSIINYLLYFKFYLEKSRRTFINTISNLKLLCKENKNLFLKEILHFDVKDYKKQIKHKSSKFSTFSKENAKSNLGVEPKKQNNEKDLNAEKKYSQKNLKDEFQINNNKIIQSSSPFLNSGVILDTGSSVSLKAQKELESRKKFKENFVKEIFDEHKITKLAIELQKDYFPDEMRIFSSKCEVELINNYQKSFNVFILTNANIYLFELDTDEFKKNSSLKLLKDSSFFKLDIEKILDLKYFDYNSRLVFEYEKKSICSFEMFLNRIKHRIKAQLIAESVSTSSDPTSASNNSSNIHNLDNNLKESNLVDNAEDSLKSNQNSSSLNFTGTDLRKDVEDEFNSSKLNSRFNSDNNSFSQQNNNENKDNNQGVFSGLFGKTDVLNGILGAGSSTQQERPISFFFSISFSSFYETVDVFNLIQDANRKLKTKFNSAKPNCSMLESFIVMHEKHKREKVIIQPKNISLNKNQNYDSKYSSDEEENHEIPIFLEDLFKKEEFEFLRNEFKIKNSFSFDDNEHVNVFIKKLKAFVINFEESSSFNLFNSINSSEYVLHKNRKIMYLGEETLYVIEENFENFDVEFFVDISSYLYNIEKNPCFKVVLEIEFKHVLDIEIQYNQCFVEYIIDGKQKKLMFEVNKTEENEFIYFYLMKKVVRNITYINN